MQNKAIYQLFEFEIMTNYQERKIEIPGFSIATKLWHPKHDRPILCLHGKMDNAASFDLLAPYLPNFQLAAIDYPGVGYSSWYPEGVMPHWKNDAFLMVKLIKTLQWKQFDILAHSLGGLLATTIAIVMPEKVGKLVYLDILGPTVNFIENGMTYIHRDLETYLSYQQNERRIFTDLESAIQDRMKIGNISYAAAAALAQRGMIKNKNGWIWNLDPKLRCISSTLPYEDELIAMFNAIKVPVCLIRANNGVPYPKTTFDKRAKAIKNLTIETLEGGHHLHMDDPEPVAEIVSKFFLF